MLLPSCDHCGRCGCVTGLLPYTVTVEFSGLANRGHTPHCELQFDACFGSGAEGVVLSPGGVDPDDRGPLTAVLVTEQGCGYAVLGRQEPAVTISGSGSGAAFTPTLSQLSDECGRPVWGVESVAVTGGTGYQDGEQLVVQVEGETVTPPALTLRNSRAQPTLTATVAVGNGAVLQVNMTSNGTTPATWGVGSVTVIDGGNAYVNGASVVFNAGNGVEVVPAVATIEAGGPPGEDQISVFEYASDLNPSTGSGAQYDYTFTADGDLWLLGVTVVAEGTGYAVGDILEFVREPLDSNNGVSLYEVTSIDGSGGITGISLTTAEPMVGSDGTITAVTITTAGQYFIDSGVPSSIAVDNAGAFYGEDTALPAIVANVTVTAGACGGSGEDITAIVDDDTASPTFGRITGLTIADGGDDHLAWEWNCTSLGGMNGQPLVLIAQNPVKLVTLDVSATFGSGACLRVVPRGEGTVCEAQIDVLYDGQPGPILEVEIVDPGSGYARVTNSGVEVATVTVGIVQLPPSDGSGASVSVTVDDDPMSLTFGQIVAVSLVGGDGYTMLGAPRDCEYERLPCFSRFVTLSLRGHGEPPRLQILEPSGSAEGPGAIVVLEADGVLDNCDTLPGTASLLYGAPAGVTATIARDGVVNTDCDYPDYCDPCICPVDYIAPETHVDVTSTVPCASGGTAEYSGQWQDLDLTCGYRLNPGDEIAYLNDVMVTLSCCAQDCDDDVPCELKVQAGVSGYCYDPDSDTYCIVNAGNHSCVAFDVASGEAVGEITFPVIATCPGGQAEYSMTVAVGGP